MILEAEDTTTAVFYSISNCQKGLAHISFGNFLIKQVARDLAAELPNLKTFVTLSPIPHLVHWLKQADVSYTNISEQTQKELAAHYLLKVKGKDGKPFDPVARFHLGNGAKIHAIHANADTSDNGMNQSHGVMVNYQYVLDEVSTNHEQYARECVIAADNQIHKLAAPLESQFPQSDS